MEDIVSQADEAGIAGHGQSRQIRGRVPSRRFGYVSVVHAGKLIVWAGFDGSRWLVSSFMVSAFQKNLFCSRRITYSVRLISFLLGLYV